LVSVGTRGLRASRSAICRPGLWRLRTKATRFHPVAFQPKNLVLGRQQLQGVVTDSLGEEIKPILDVIDLRVQRDLRFDFSCSLA
jgi:hypothetical protein